MLLKLTPKTIPVLGAALCTVLCSCSAIRNINLYTTAEEVQLGQELDKEIRKQYKILDDEKLTAFISARGKRLGELSQRPNLEYHFAVVASDEVNAFAIPGGYCYVNVGLIRESQTEAELISVLAHEISHVVHRHGMKRLSSMQMLELGTNLALGSNPNTIISIVAGLGTTTGLLLYSREDERDADRSGLLNMYADGYDPQGMVNLFEILKAHREGPDPKGWEKAFTTHPITDERIANAKALIAQLPPREGTLIVNSPEWVGIKEYVAEKYPKKEPEKPEQKPGEK